MMQREQLGRSKTIKEPATKGRRLSEKVKNGLSFSVLGINIVRKYTANIYAKALSRQEDENWKITDRLFRPLFSLYF